MLTQRDIDELETNFKEVFATKDDLKEMKSDLLDVMDEILKEVKDSREERTILSHKVSEHEERIKTVEEALDITS